MIHCWQTVLHTVCRCFLSFTLAATDMAVAVVSFVLCRGWTRKEPFANNFAGLNWTPQAENWNGR